MTVSVEQQAKDGLGESWGQQKGGLYLGLAFVVLLLIALLPLLLCSPLPLGDYSNHLARIHIIANIGQSTDLARFYEVTWAIIPNLASDLLVPFFVHLTGWSVETTLTLFAALGLALIASGAVVLNRVLYGRWSWLSLSVFLFLYNRHFLWGFLNYIFTIGLMLWVLAAWIYCRQRFAWPLRLLFALPVLLIFFGHLFPLGVYGVSVMGYEVWQWWISRERSGSFVRLLRNVFVAGLQFIPPLILLLRF